LYRKSLIMLTAATLVASVSACGALQHIKTLTDSSSPPPARSASSAPRAAGHPTPLPAGSLRLLTEPADGIGPIYQSAGRVLRLT